MKLARIVAPFGLSAVLSILSYLSLKDIGSGFYSILLMVIGIVLVGVGIAAVFSDKWTLFEAGLLSQMVQIRQLPEIQPLYNLGRRSVVYRKNNNWRC